MARPNTMRLIIDKQNRKRLINQFNKTTNVDKRTFMNVIKRILKESSLTLDDLHHNVCLTNHISKYDLLDVLRIMELNKKVKRINGVYYLF